MEINSARKNPGLNNSPLKQRVLRSGCSPSVLARPGFIYSANLCRTFSLSTYISVSCLFLSPIFYLLCLYLYLYACLSLSQSVCLCVCIFLPVSVSVSHSIVEKLPFKIASHMKTIIDLKKLSQKNHFSRLQVFGK